MEVRYDRSLPQEDVFEVQVLDDTGKLLRKERFTRNDVESTVRDLFPGNVRPADDEERKKFERQHDARWEKIRSYFPDAGTEKKAAK